MSSFGPVNTFSSYLAEEFDLPDSFSDARELITERERLQASIINVKENGMYEQTEILSAQLWYSTSPSTSGSIYRYGFRTTCDLVALNGGPIGAGATVLTLTSSTIPPAIIGAVTPVPSGGSATTATGVFLWLNESRVFVDFNPTTQNITITNNYGSNLTQCYFVISYLKQT